MDDSANHPRTSLRWAALLTLILVVALGLRVAAAFVVTRYAEGQGKLCVFGDTKIYWDLARSIVRGEPYVVLQFGSPHYALRTPGYPAFLAVCWKVFGENLLAVRLVQAALGVLSVWLVARLAGAVLGVGKIAGERDAPPPQPSLTGVEGDRGGGQRNSGVSIPLLAAGLAAIHPYLVGMSALVLSEAIFLPLMMLGLWGLARLWDHPKRPRFLAIGTGLAMGGAILARPSWALFVPMILAGWVVGAGRGNRWTAFRGSVLVALATCSILAPWWIRNERVIGRFVPTALWVGASLYDGIGPQADGSSAMAFVEGPDVRSLGESEQDAVFRKRSIDFARSHPGRVLELAGIKLARFWSPWPNADTLRSRWASVASALVTLPIFGLIAVGAFDRRRDFRAIVLLGGPLVYFCVLHMVFVSSIRYRIPGELPAMGLAGVALGRILGRLRPMSIRRRVGKWLGWATVLVLSVLVGGALYAYFYVTDSDTLSDLIRREAPTYLPHCRVDVAKVRVRPFGGEVTVSTLLIRELAGGSPGPMVGQSPWIQVRFDPWAMMKGKFECRDVTVAKPTLRLMKRADGTWNLQGLLANPWPQSMTSTPPVAIQDGTVELIDEGATAPLTILRDVSIKIPATSGSGAPVHFELTARGEAGLFYRVRLQGSVEIRTGRVTLKGGELLRLTLSEGLRDRLPAALARAFGQAGLDGGEIDADLSNLSFDPNASPRLHYQGSASLRRGLWKCPKLPFPISDVSVNATIKDGDLSVQGMGSDGSTALNLDAKATLNLDDPMMSPFEVKAEANNLELDARLRRWIPDDKRELWDAYFPQVNAPPFRSAGRVNIVANAHRDAPSSKIDYVVDVTCTDVSMKYRHFPYPVDHVRGNLHFVRGKLALKVETVIGNQPLLVTGDIDDPGPNADARLTFQVASLPIDEVLRKALPEEVKRTVDQFKPKGSVSGTAKLRRQPPLAKGDDPRGRVTFDAWIDLNPDCSVTWEGLKYPVMNLVGRLEIHPNHWIFTRMRGNNGQARIWADGDVRQLKRDVFKVDVHIQAENLPFDDQLKNALPTPWQVTWNTLNPTGASDIDAVIKVEPGKPENDRIVIIPRASTGVKLRFNPLVGEGVAPTPIELRMDEVSGRFVYDTADLPHTSMKNVAFKFQGSPVKFEKGTVDVKDSGQFNLDVGSLEVLRLRLDDGLRRYMPPVMAENARRLNDDQISYIKADLNLGWSGKVGESAWCRWKNALVILYNNRISAGTDLSLEHIEGQFEEGRGSFNGRELEVYGKLNLNSVSVFKQQVSYLTANLEVKDGRATLKDIKAKVLGGNLNARVSATLDATPQYSLWVDLQKANLTEYAMTQPGHQGFKGLVTAHIDLSGFGNDLHTITGEGRAKIVDGDLGTLPIALRFFNALKPGKDTKAAFDSAELAFTIVNGDAKLDPVRLVGNAFSLDGSGKLDVRGEINVKLKILPGRDGWHIPLISSSIRELGGQILVIRVHGQAASPSFNLELIPATGELGKTFKQNQETRKTGLVGPMRNGIDLRPRTGITNRWFGPSPVEKID